MSLSSCWNWLADEPRQRTGIRVFQICIGLAILSRLVILAPFAPYFWGPHGIGSGSERHGDGLHGWALDHVFATEAGTWLLLLVLGLGALALVLGYRTWTATAVLALVQPLWLARCVELADGGDNLTSLALIYMLLVLPAGARVRPQGLRVWLHNLGVVLLTAQVMILYVTSGMAKARGEVWFQGTAMYVISQVEVFSLPWLRPIFSNPVVTTATSWTTILFQTWFPVAVLSPLKLVWIGLAVFFHVGVGSFMGLVSFSLVMMGADLMLISDAEYAKVKEWRIRLAARARSVLASPAAAPITAFIGGWCSQGRRFSPGAQARELVEEGQDRERLVGARGQLRQQRHGLLEEEVQDPHRGRDWVERDRESRSTRA